MGELIPSMVKQFDHNDDHIKNILFLSREENPKNPFRRGHVQDDLHEAIDFL